MNVQIFIQAESISDLYTAVSEIRRLIKLRTKIDVLNPITDDFPEDMEIFDENCYGSVLMQVLSEEKEEGKHGTQ
jgi:hypothetical protein